MPQQRNSLRLLEGLIRNLRLYAPFTALRILQWQRGINNIWGKRIYQPAPKCHLKEDISVEASRRAKIV